MGNAAKPRTVELRKPRVFISRTTAGMKKLADEIAEILRNRGVEPIVQTEFLPDWRNVPQMLQDKLLVSDSVIALIGPVYGGEPEHEPARLKDPRTHGRHFSFTQWEYLVARDLRRPVFTFLVSGPELVAPFPPEDPILVQRQQLFIEDFPRDRQTLFYEYTQRDLLFDHIRRMELPLSAVAGKPTNIPYASLGTLFKGRDDFLTQLRDQLSAAAATVIKGHRTIHGMGGVGKTRTAIEYAWKHADDYNALLFVTADSPADLRRNIAALCGPLVLNLPEQDEKDINLRFEAALRWLEIHPGWFLIIDNVDTDDAVIETRSLLERLSKGHVVITSRISDWAGQVKALDLDVLSTAASIEFLDERTAERRIRQEDDSETVEQLVQVLDCLALALEQAGALISCQRISYSDYIALWESQRPVALAWHDEETMKYPRSLAITYETSVAQLSSGARELFRTLSWFAPDPIPRGLFESRPHPEDERRHFVEIERLHLARMQTDGKSFTVHRLNQEITRQQQLETRPEPLLGALAWVDQSFQGNPTDVRCWPILLPLTSHAIYIATFSADRNVNNPSSSLFHLAGTLLREQAEFDKAEPLLRRALLVDEQSYDATHPIVARDLESLALLLMNTDRFSESEHMMRRVLMICENSHRCAPEDLATSLSNLALLLRSTNRPAEAEQLMRRALALDEHSQGAEHTSVARDTLNLTNFLQDANRLEEAEPLLRRTLATHEQSYGTEHPAVSTSLNNLAMLLKNTNRLNEAEPLLRRALSIDERAYGTKHPHYTDTLTNLALVLQDMNRLSEAEDVLRRVLAIDEQIYGADHSKLARDLSNLAHLLHYTNREKEAEPLLRRALAIMARTKTEQNPDYAVILHNLGNLLRATGHFTEAEPILRDALSISEQPYGPEHPTVGKILNDLALLLQATHRPQEAEPLFRRALANLEKSKGREHPDVATLLNNFGLLLHATNRLGEAESLFRRALAIDEKSYGAKHPHVAGDFNNLAGVLLSTNRLVEAEPLFRQALEIYRTSFGDDHPHTKGVQGNYERTVRELAANDSHPYLQLLLLKQHQCAAIQIEAYEVAATFRDKIAVQQTFCDQQEFHPESMKMLDRVAALTCISVPVKTSIGGRLISAERQKQIRSELDVLGPGIAVIEEYFAEFPDYRFRDLCDRLSNVPGRIELFSDLDISDEAQKQGNSVSPEAWLAYAISVEIDGSTFLYCIANRWAQLLPTLEEVVQVADAFERLGYPSEAAALRDRFSEGGFDSGDE